MVSAMKNHIVYHVVERNSSSKIVSQLYTKSAMVALSDILLKSRINESPDIGSNDSCISKKSYFYQGYSRVRLPQIISGSLTTINTRTMGIISTVTIETLVSKESIADGFTDSTDSLYRSTSYIRSIAKFSNRLRAFSRSDIDIALVVTALAAREKSNHFWHEREVQGWKERKLELF